MRTRLRRFVGAGHHRRASRFYLRAPNIWRSVFGPLLEAEYDIHYSDTLTISSGAASQVRDRSGNGHTQNGATSDPAYSASGGPGGRAYVTSSTANQGLVASDFAIAEGDNPSLLVVARFNATPAYANAAGLSASGGGGGEYMNVWSDGSVWEGRVHADSSESDDLMTTAEPSTTASGWHFAEAHARAGGDEFFLDGSETSGSLSGGVSSRASGTDTLALCYGPPSGGGSVDVALCLVLNAEPTAAQLAVARSVVASKYGITMA